MGDRPVRCSEYVVYGCLGLLVLCYIVCFSAISSYLHLTYATSAYDVGLMDQTIWRMSQGLAPFSTIKGVNIFGDHSFYYCLFFVPLYALYPTIHWLYFAQSFFLGLSAIPLFLFARKQGCGNFISLSLVTGLLLYPALQNMNLENFHPESISVFFASCMLYFISKKRGRIAFLCAIFTVLAKEDVGLHVAGIGAILALTKNQRSLGLSLVALGGFWYLMCTRILMPYAQGIEVTSTNQPLIYSYWFNDFRRNIFNLSYYLNTFSDERILRYALDLLGPTAFLALLAPKILIFALPAFMINCLTGNDYIVSVGWHYNYGTIAPIFFASAAGSANLIRRISTFGPRLRSSSVAIIAVVVVSCSILFNLHSATLSLSRICPTLANAFRRQTKTEYLTRQQAFSLVPAQAMVSATHSLVPHLTHRPNIFMFPNPFRGTLWNMWFREDQNLPNPEDNIDFLVIDSNSHQKEDRLILTSLSHSPRFETIFEERGIQVLRRVAYTPSADQGAHYTLVQNTSLTLQSDFRGLVPVEKGKFSMLYFPASRYRFRNLLGEELPITENWGLLVEGNFIVTGRSASAVKLSCAGECRLELDGAGSADGKTVSPGIHHFTIKYIPRDTFGLMLGLTPSGNNTRTFYEDELWTVPDPSTIDPREARSLTMLQSANKTRITNLLFNGDFELQQSSTPEGWNFDGWVAPDADASCKAQTQGAHSGRFSAKVEHKGLADSRCSQDITAKRGQRYRLSGWISSHQIPADRFGYLELVGAGVSARSAKITGSKPWQYVEVEAKTASSDTESSTLKVQCRLGDYGLTTSGTLLCDDLVLEEIE